jgi:tetratricopeptide (TPR) repeat protein
LKIKTALDPSDQRRHFPPLLALTFAFRQELDNGVKPSKNRRADFGEFSVVGGFSGRFIWWERGVNTMAARSSVCELIGVKQQMTFEERRYLEAAQGWLGLGHWAEAEAELNNISAPQSSQAEVLQVRYEVHAAAKQWDVAGQVALAIARAFPSDAFGWLGLAHALHQEKRTREARKVLMVASERFPEECAISYNLACYACQIGDLKEAARWLQKAVTLACQNSVRLTVCEEPDLAPLWQGLREA